VAVASEATTFVSFTGVAVAVAVAVAVSVVETTEGAALRETRTLAGAAGAATTEGVAGAAAAGVAATEGVATEGAAEGVEAFVDFERDEVEFETAIFVF
jgi:hypothetical protein